MEDVKEYYQMAHNDEAIKKYVPSSYPSDPREAYELVGTYSQGDCSNDFYLLIEKNGIMIGAIIAVRTIGKTLDTSAFIFKPYRGKGIMTIVLSEFRDWLKRYTDFEEMSLVIKKGNNMSLMQAQKCGVVFQKEDEENEFYKIYLKQ